MSGQEQTGTGQGLTTITGGYQELFQELYLNPTQFTALQCHRFVQARAYANDDAVPGVASFMRELRGNFTDEGIARHRAETPVYAAEIDNINYSIFRGLYLCGKGYSLEYCYSRLFKYQEEGEEFPGIVHFVQRLSDDIGDAEIIRIREGAA